MNKFVLLAVLMLTSCLPTTEVTDARLPVVSGNFRIYKLTDPITGEDNSSILTSEVDPPLGRSGYMAWGCQEEILRVFFVLDNGMGNNSNVQVQFRVDDLDAISAQGWQVKNEGLFFPPIEGLDITTAIFVLQSERFALRVFDVDNTPYTYLFDLSGIRTALSRLSCAQWLF
jgi:hypothetical protein